MSRNSGRRPWRALGGGRAPAVVVSAAILAVSVGASIAIAREDTGRPGAGIAGEDATPLELGRSNGTSSNPISGQTELFARNNQYALRESNLSNAGGGAIHGCRTQTPPPNAANPGDKPCLRSNNLSTGQAFQFQTTQGNVGGRIQVGGTDINQTNPNGVPFETNAGGRVANLNADKVDGLDATQLQGQQGPPGPTGPQGPQGPQGEPATMNLVERYGPNRTISPGSSVASSLVCEPGELATGGGADFVGGSTASMFIQDSQAVPLITPGTPVGWFVRVFNDSPTINLTFRAMVVCLTP